MIWPSGEYRECSGNGTQNARNSLPVGAGNLQGSKETNAVEQALHEFELELNLSPDNSDAEYEIGEIYRQRGEFEPALAHLL